MIPLGEVAVEHIVAVKKKLKKPHFTGSHVNMAQNIMIAAEDTCIKTMGMTIGEDGSMPKLFFLKTMTAKAKGTRKK